jgi:hypothetical protein
MGDEKEDFIHMIEFKRATYFNKNMLNPNYQFSMP